MATSPRTEGSAMAEFAWQRGWRTASLATDTVIVYFRNVVLLPWPVGSRERRGRGARRRCRPTRSTPASDALLDSLQLRAYADAPADSLPHGDERRLGVARALATEPRFVLMDEPAAGLPEAEVPAFAEVVRSVRDDHDAGVAAHRSQHGADHGRLRSHPGARPRADAGGGLAERDPRNLDVAAAYLGESAVQEDVP